MAVPDCHPERTNNATVHSNLKRGCVHVFVKGGYCGSSCYANFGNNVQFNAAMRIINERPNMVAFLQEEPLSCFKLKICAIRRANPK